MKKRIITISRQYGSGGRKIGERVAAELGIAFYDKKLIGLAAERSGLSPAFIEDNEQKITNSFLFNVAINGYYPAGTIPYRQDTMRPQDNLFLTQIRVIQELAAEGPCVIVGRCSNYILRDREDRLDVFLYADPATRIKRAVERYGMPPAKAEQELRRRDRARANHYGHYTGQAWGDILNYHLCIHTGVVGEDEAVEIIKSQYGR